MYIHQCLLQALIKVRTMFFKLPMNLHQVACFFCFILEALCERVFSEISISGVQVEFLGLLQGLMGAWCPTLSPSSPCTATACCSPYRLSWKPRRLTVQLRYMESVLMTTTTTTLDITFATAAFLKIAFGCCQVVVTPRARASQKEPVRLFPRRECRATRSESSRPLLAGEGDLYQSLHRFRNCKP